MASKYEFTHTITLIKREGGFSPSYKNIIVKCRILKHEIALENGTKYKKSDGLMSGGHRYRGVYMESTKVDMKTLKIEKKQ